jgi:hypothetical protein
MPTLGDSPVMILHIVKKDGSVEHQDMTRSNWEAAMRNPDVARQWSHKPNDCTDHLVPFLEKLKSRRPAIQNLPACKTDEQKEKMAAVKRVIDLSIF